MYCKKITYIDYNDVQHTEEFYFNLNRAEILNMLTTESDATLDQVFEYFRQTRNSKALLKMVEDLIKSSYGVKSPDGKRFVKSPEITEAFVQSEAYSELLFELLNDSDATAKFFIGIVPRNLQGDLEKFYASHPNMTPEDVEKFAEEQRQQVGVSLTPTLVE